jgi:hypothetical protein
MSDTELEAASGGELVAKIEAFLDSLPEGERQVVGEVFAAAATSQTEPPDDDVEGHWWKNCVPYTTCYYSCVAGRRSGGDSWTNAAMVCGSYCRRRHPGCG